MVGCLVEKMAELLVAMMVHLKVGLLELKMVGLMAEY